MCEELEDVTPKEWNIHKGRVKAVETRITELEAIAQSGKNWVKMIGILFLGIQGFIGYLVATPNSNEKSIIRLIGQLEANSSEDKSHHENGDLHMPAAMKSEIFVPRKEIDAKFESKESKLEAMKARTEELRAHTDKSVARLEAQTIRLEQKLDGNRALLLEVLQRTPKK